MVPIIAIIGKTNVGKSTLFNQLTYKNNALVNNIPNSTRDRKYGYFHCKNEKFLVVDTAGINQLNNSRIIIENKIFYQTKISIKEANLIFFVLDICEGVSPLDKEIVKDLKKKKKNIFLIINKIDKVKSYEFLMYEFYCLGIKKIVPISAISNKKTVKLIEKYLILWIKDYQTRKGKVLLNDKFAKDRKIINKDNMKNIKVSIIGKPNIGKSTLLNSLLNENRVITHNLPGTTRDSIAVPIDLQEKKYTIIDTAGIKKKYKIQESIQTLSNVKTMQSISQSNVIILMLDGIDGVSNQDISILNTVIKFGKALIIIINKSENLSFQQKTNIKENLFIKNTLIKFIRIHFISALHRKGINHIFKLINEAYENSIKVMKSSELTNIMKTAIEKHPPALIKGKKIKLKYAHPGGYNPPTIVIHGNQIFFISSTYKRYLMNFFQKSLNIKSTPVKIIFKNNKNPYI